MPYMKRYAGYLTAGLAVCDTMCAAAGFMLAVHLSHPSASFPAFVEQCWTRIGYLLVFVAFWYGAAADQGLFLSHRDDRLLKQLLAVVKAAAVSIVFSLFVVVFFTRKGLDREFLLYFGTSVFAAILIFRLALRLFLWNIRRRGFNFRQALVVGANRRSRRLVEVFTVFGRYGYQIIGIVDDDPARMEVFGEKPVKYLGPCASLETFLANHVVDELYITLPVRSFYEEIRNIAHLCESVGIPVRMVADLFPLQIATSRVTRIEDIPLLSLATGPEVHGQLLLKRAFDFAASSVLLALFAPLFFVVGILIKAESPGPVFFKQERVGLNQRRFKIFKFRSMRADAEKLRKELEEHNEADGPVFKIRNDPRVTRVGRFIRKYSIDELPQLINVWLGHMSLVGPRPPIPAEVEQYTWDQRRRLSVKPGMTGLWQVSGRSDVNFQDWVDMDLAYIDSWTFLQDIRILIKTVQVVLQGKGAA